MKKSDIMELTVKVTLSEEAITRIEAGGLGVDCYKMTADMFTPDRVYETVGLAQKNHGDNTFSSIYYIFDDQGQLRETSIGYWVKQRRREVDSGQDGAKYVAFDRETMTGDVHCDSCGDWLGKYEKIRFPKRCFRCGHLNKAKRKYLIRI